MRGSNRVNIKISGISNVVAQNFLKIALKMDYSRKNSNKGVEDMEFPRVLKKTRLLKFQGSIKKKWNFQG